MIWEADAVRQLLLCAHRPALGCKWLLLKHQLRFTAHCTKKKNAYLHLCNNMHFVLNQGNMVMNVYDSSLS